MAITECQHFIVSIYAYPLPKLAVVSLPLFEVRSGRRHCGAYTTFILPSCFPMLSSNDSIWTY